MSITKKVLAGFALLLSGLLLVSGSAASAKEIHPVFFIQAGKSASLDPNNLLDWYDLTRNYGPAETMGGVEFDDKYRAVKFSGGYYAAPSGFEDFSNGISIVVRANFGKEVNRWERVVDFGNGMESNNIVLSRDGDSDEIMFEVWQGSVRVGRATTKTSPLKSANRFHTFAATLNKDRVPKIYIDGKLQKIEISWSGLDTTKFSSMPPVVYRSNNYIGRSNWPDDEYFEGSIKYLKIYDQALSKALLTK